MSSRRTPSVLITDRYAAASLRTLGQASAISVSPWSAE